MGIRTVGFEKNSLSSGKRIAQEQNTKSQLQQEDLQKACTSEATVTVADSNAEILNLISSPRKSGSKFSRSPTKLRTPPMARIGGMKATTSRKLRKHRKRSMFVHSATKILRTSINVNKSRRAEVKSSDKPREGAVLPSRISTRTCVRRVSREGIIPEAPLRTVELIKRPLELREPATKILYLASLGLYPKTGESDMTPIVVIKEFTCSPGKRNSVRKSMELPLMPYHKRCIDLTNQDKRSISENIKPVGKQTKRDNRKPSTVVSDNISLTSKELIEKAIQAATATTLPSTNQHYLTETVKFNDLSKLKISSSTLNGYHKNINPASTSKASSTANSSTLSTTAIMHFPVDANETTVTLNPKSLLRNNLTLPTNQKLLNSSVLNLKTKAIMNSEGLKSGVPFDNNRSLVSNACNGSTVAMNLILSNISIRPQSSISPVSLSKSRKRSASPASVSEFKPLEVSKSYQTQMAFDFGKRISEPSGKPPTKKHKQNAKNGKLSKLSLSAIINTRNPGYQNNLFIQPIPSQTAEEALNLCVKNRNSEQQVLTSSKLPPKLQSSPNNAIPNEQQKISAEPKPINLIIPRPPPLVKAPLELTNGATFPQSLTKSKPKKANTARKPRQNSTKPVAVEVQHQANLLIKPIVPPAVVKPSETAVNTKSLLKCMNDEENTCVREVGESLDSVKTMLARLQTRIGPAVNGVRLITIE